MLKQLIYKLKTTVAGGAIIIAVFSVISRILGLVRDRLLAFYFGAGDVTDAYLAAFRLPDLIFNTLILGALGVAFIPVFLEYWHQNQNYQGEQEAWKIANTVLNLIVIGMLVLTLLGIIFAPLIVPLLTPGFKTNPAKLALTIKLTRIMFLSLIFFGASNLVGAILNSFKRFLAYSFAPVLYNLGIILGIVVFIKWFGYAGLGWGVVLGACLHLLIQLPAVARIGFKYSLVFAWAHQGVKKIWRLMLPRVIGLLAGQINLIIITIIASTLVTGSVSVFYLANNLQSFPVSIFGISLATAAFPVFSQAFVLKDQERFKLGFANTLRRILFLIFPTSIFILLLRAQIVRLILGTGAFDWEDTIMTAQTLGYFSLSLFAQALIPLFARAFYALHDTKTPVYITGFAVVLNIFASLYLGQLMGIEGLALAFSIASVVQLLMLFIILHNRLKDLRDIEIINSATKIFICSVVAGLAMYGTLHLVAPLVDMHTFIGILIQASGAFITGCLAYLGLAFLVSCEEINIIKDFLKRRLNPVIKK